MTTNMIMRASEIFGAALVAGFAWVLGASLCATAIGKLNAWLGRRMGRKLEQRLQAKADATAAARLQAERGAFVTVLEDLRRRLGVAGSGDLVGAIEEMKNKAQLWDAIVPAADDGLAPKVTAKN